MRFRIIALLGLSLSGMTTVGFADAPVGPSTFTVMSNGATRSYLLYVPAGYSGEPVPLVLNFHGSGGIPDNQLATSRFDVIADRETVAVAFPAGVFRNTVSERSWNANIEPGVDDVQFARDVIGDVSTRINVDASRIYATGMSGGARMTSRLACELADQLAAAAPVAGLQYPDGCVPSRGVPILAFHGKADRVNQFEVSANSRPYWRMGVETAFEKWRRAEGCEAGPAITPIDSRTELRVWSDCLDGSEVRLRVSDTDDHVWPEGASESIWAFFAAHRR